MSRNSERDLKPRNGHTLIVGIGARISGCTNQKELSNEDQVDHGKQELAGMYEGPVDYRIIATKGKGERLDRPELELIESELRKEEIDVFIFEDLGRLVRGTEAVRLLGIAVDHGTRVIVPNDCIDTADDTWEEDAIAACRDHVGHNAHTSKRLKHKLMNRFKKFGGAMAREIAGYIVADDAKTYDDWQKDPTAEFWIHQGAKLLRETGNCSAVADLFNRLGIPLGPYCRRKTWDGKMVRRFYENTLLKGMPGRGFKHTVKHHESGRRKSVLNPKGPAYRECPHLAYFSSEEFDGLSASLKTQNAYYKRKAVNGVDPLSRVPRKRTRFPGQFGCCWYCGRQHVWGGNGVTDNLMCNGSREWLCWNSVGYEGRLAVEKLVERITAELYGLDGFDDQYRDLVAAALQGDQPDVARRRDKLRSDEQLLAVQKANLQKAILEYGTGSLIKGMLAEIDASERKLNSERRLLERISQDRLQIPVSLGELRGLLETEFAQGVHDSPEFGDLLRKIVLDFRVHLVRLCDGGHLLPRARVKLALDGIVADAAQVPGVSELLYREFTLDLFKRPQREQIREQSVGLSVQGLGPKAIAAQILDDDGKHPTATAVQDALALDRLMKQMGLMTPYVSLIEPPNDYAKLRRHRNDKYRFTPLDGYEPPTL